MILKTRTKKKKKKTATKQLRLQHYNIYKFKECIRGHINIDFVFIWFIEDNAISQESSVLTSFFFWIITQVSALFNLKKGN